MSFSESEKTAYMAGSCLVWGLSTVIILVLWLLERSKRHPMKILRFRPNSVTVVKSQSPRLASKNSTSPTTAETKDYIEAPLHYISYLVCLFAFTAAFSAVLARLYIVYQGFAFVCRAVTLIQNISWSLHKVFAVLFQLKRYQMCLEPTRGLRIFYIVLESVVLIEIGLIVSLPIFLSETSVWNGWMCSFNISIIFVIATGIPYFAVDLALLGTFVIKVRRMSQTLHKQKQDFAQKNQLRSATNVSKVNTRLFYILKRVILLSMIMEVATIFTLLNIIINDEAGSITGVITAFFLALDLVVNVKCVLLMFEHNTNEYEKLLKILENLNCCKASKQDEETVKKIASFNDVPVDKTTEEKNEPDHDPESIVIDDPTCYDEGTQTNFGVEKSDFVSQKSRDDTRLDDPL